MKLLVLSIFLIAPHSIFANQIRYAKGQVSVNGKESPKGTKVLDNDLIKVGPKSLAILELDDGSKIKINEDTEIKVVNETKEAPATALLGQGSAFFKITKMLNQKVATDKFKVKTRQASLGVRGTEFFVSYGKNKTQDIWMCVNEGLVEARSLKGTTFVKQGEGIQVKQNKISTPKPLAWTKKLNWSTDENSNDLENKVSIEEAYTDILEKDYD